SPYNRTRAGWTRAGGGASTRTNKGSPPSSIGSPRPTAPSRSSTTPSDSQKHRGDRTPGGEKRPPGGDQEGEDISVAPPPSSKSSAAPRVAGAWPSGGAGTRTAKAAAETEAASTATTPSTAAAGTKKSRGEKGAAAAVGGKKGSATTGEDQQQNKPSLEASETARSLEDVEYNGSSHGENRHGTNRQHRSSSIPWVEEAAIGKHYQPPFPTKIVGEAETGRDFLESTKRPSSDPNTVRQTDLDGNSSSSSNHNAAERRVSATQGGASARGGTGTGGGDDDPKRRTSSVSWAEDIVAGNEGDRRQQESPQERAQSLRDSPVKASTMKHTAKPSSGTSGSSDNRNVGEDNREKKRRTSSVSWAEDIAEGRDGDTQVQPSSQQGVKSAVDASVGASGTETAAKASPEARNGGADSEGVDEVDREPKRRTSSVSWAEDIAEGTESLVQPQSSLREKRESALDTQNRRTSSISWAEDIVADQAREAQ
ncbi:unnamed protein product, partial [Scytosiphon promiscuus]